MTAAPVRGSDITTFQLGGPLRRFVDAENLEQAREALREAVLRGEPTLIVGGGSNLLISDHGFDGLVLRWLAPPNIRVFDNELETDGGVELDAVAAFCAAEGFDGFSFATGIPGTVAGAIVGNAGAYGRAISDPLVAIRVYDPVNGSRVIARKSLKFWYRGSSLVGSGLLIESARFRITRGDRRQLADERARILELRRQRHPDWKQIPTAGSFFKNIEPTSSASPRQAAGWYLEQVGALTMRVGGAGVYPKHANIIIKCSPDCTATDVYRLSCQMAEAVRNRFGLRLEREVRLIGFFDPGEPQARCA